jgi:hypothetical protein
MEAFTGDVDLEDCNCTYCNFSISKPCTVEEGFHTIRCTHCGFLHFSSRPTKAERTSASDSGAHAAADYIVIYESYVPAKVSVYQAILAETFSDVWSSSELNSRKDIGFGPNKVMNAFRSMATPETDKTRC